MINFYHDLYVDDYVKDNLAASKIEVALGKPRLAPLYVIALAENEHNLLDIISCNELYFKYYKNKVMNVIGIASSYKDAVKLTETIIMDVYTTTGGFDVRNSFRM